MSTWQVSRHGVGLCFQSKGCLFLFFFLQKLHKFTKLCTYGAHPPEESHLNTYQRCGLEKSEQRCGMENRAKGKFDQTRSAANQL